MSVSQKTAAPVSDAVSKLDQTAALMDFCVGKRRGIPEAGLETVSVRSKVLFLGFNTVCVLFLR